MIADRALARLLPAVPRPIVRRIASRYIAGEALSDALRVVRELNAAGKAASVDLLGEEAARPQESLAVVDEYLRVLGAIAEEGLDADVSVKPTALGLELDHEFCRDNLATLLEAAVRRKNRVEVDMEDSSTTSATLALYRELRADGPDALGIVLQATLRRTLDDVEALAGLRPSVRVCKGIYVEPPGVAYQGREAIRFNFARTVEALLHAGAYVAVATHDEPLLDECLLLVDERGLGPTEYEVQMLLGVKPDLGDRLVAEGRRVRVYVPYGRRWYEYSVRRLQENPAVATSVALDTLRRLRP